MLNVKYVNICDVWDFIHFLSIFFIHCVTYLNLKSSGYIGFTLHVHVFIISHHSYRPVGLRYLVVNTHCLHCHDCQNNLHCFQNHQIHQVHQIHQDHHQDPLCLDYDIGIGYLVQIFFLQFLVVSLL